MKESRNFSRQEATEAPHSSVGQGGDLSDPPVPPLAVAERWGGGNTMSSGVTIQHPALPIPGGLGLLRGRGEEEGQSQQSGGKQLLDTAGKKQLPNCTSLLEKGRGREVTRCWHQHRNTWQGQGSQGGEASITPKLLQPLGAQPGLQLLIILPELLFFQPGPDTSLQQC